MGHRELVWKLLRRAVKHALLGYVSLLSVCCLAEMPAQAFKHNTYPVTHDDYRVWLLTSRWPSTKTIPPTFIEEMASPEASTSSWQRTGPPSWAVELRLQWMTPDETFGRLICATNLWKGHYLRPGPRSPTSCACPQRQAY